MKIGKARVTSSLMSAVLFLGLVQVPAAHAPQTPEQLAQQSAESWLALVDSGKYADSWQEASSMFKTHVTKDQWQSMIAAARDELPGTAVEGCRATPVEQLVVRLREQEVALGPRDTVDPERGEFGQVLRRKFVILAGGRVVLRPEIGCKGLLRIGDQVDQDRLHAVHFGQTGGVEAAERAADKA